MLNLSLGIKQAELKSGQERFTENSQPLNYSLLDFWRWSASDILSNSQRGILAEFIVARAVGIDTQKPRNEWDAYDLTTERGVRIEVKASSYLQSWHQEKLSSIVFSIRKARTWDPNTNKLSPDTCRASDIYVFALLAHQDKDTVNPMNLDEWRFFVVPTNRLNERTRSQHSITLVSLRKLSVELTYFELRDAVDAAY